MAWRELDSVGHGMEQKDQTLSKHCVRQWNWEVQLLGAVQRRVKVKGPFLNTNTRKHRKKPP